MEFDAHIVTENLIVAPSVLVLTCDVKMTPHTIRILGLISVRKNGEIGLVLFMEIVAASLNLMIGF